MGTLAADLVEVGQRILLGLGLAGVIDGGLGGRGRFAGLARLGIVAAGCRSRRIGGLLFLLEALLLQLADGEELKDPVLHVLQPVVILFQDPVGAPEVDLVVGALAPGQLRDPLQVCADDLVLGRLRRCPVQPAEFAVHFLPGRLRQRQGLDALPQFVGVLPVSLFTELLADLFHLLAQQHFALAFPQLLLDLGLDVLLGVDPHQLPLHRHERRLHALLVVEHFEQPLLFGGGKFEVEDDQVRERTRFVHTLDDLVQCLRGLTTARSQLRGALTEFRVQRLELGVPLVDGAESLEAHQRRAEHRVAVAGILDRARPRLALHQQLDAATRPMGLYDSDDGAHRVQDLRIGLILVLVLGHRKEKPVAVHGLLDSLHRARPARRNRHGHAGVDHRLPQREHRE